MRTNDKIFIIDSTGGTPTFSGDICPVMANIIEACDSDNTIILDSGSTIFNKIIVGESDLFIGGKITGYNGQLISGKILSGNTSEEFELVDFPIVQGNDFFTTGVTLSNNILTFDRNDMLSAYTVDLSSLSTEDIYTTGVTLNNNILSFNRTDSEDAYSVDLSSLSAETPSLQEVIDVDQVADRVIFREDLTWSATTNNVIYGSYTYDDSTLLLGFFTNYNGVTANKLVRIDNLGNLDPTFNIGSGPNNNVFIPNAILKTNDGIYIGADFTIFNGTSVGRIVRLNNNGSIDSTFNTGGAGFANYVAAINEDANGKLVISGRLTNYNGVPVSPITGGAIPTGLIRLNSDGSVDPTFSGVTGGTNNVTQDSIIDLNGKIYLTGYGNILNGQASSGIMRFNQDGSTDTSFVVGTGFNAGTGIVNQLTIDNLNRLYVHGLSTIYQGVTINRLVRLNQDGSIDTSFSGGTRFNGSVYGFKIQNDGKLLVGGFFSSYDGVPYNGMIRLNDDGTIDSSFSNGFNAGAGVETITILSNGKILVTGEGFTTYDGIPVSYTVIMNEDGSYCKDRELTFQNGVAEYNITELSSTIPSEILPKSLIEDLIETYEHTSPSGTIDIDSSTATNIKFEISDIVLDDIDGKEESSNKVNSLTGTSDNYPSITALDNVRHGSFGITIDGGGTSPTNGIKGYVSIPYNCTIIGWDVIADGTGNCVLDVWRSNGIPTYMDTITGTEKPTLSTEQIHRNDSLTTWDTEINENDIVAFNLESSTNVNRITLIIKIFKY